MPTYKIRTKERDGKILYELYDAITGESYAVDERYIVVKNMREGLEKEAA